ncbi:MAG TPA: molybdopterin-dependent oxidoreductase, partial [Terriglobales bacterium]|nr:molybdopterin-dependent oxidoreductase [Terriglobales bacterium]
MSMDAAGRKQRQWVSLIPYGVTEQHPNAYKDIASTIWENRDNLGYAWRILNNGCCDGCSLGTMGMRDWTMKGVHLCAVRLQLLRLNTMPAMDWRKLENVDSLRGLSERQLRKLGRLAVPMIRRRGEKGFRRVSWDEALSTVAVGLRET